MRMKADADATLAGHVVVFFASLRHESRLAKSTGAKRGIVQRWRILLTKARMMGSKSSSLYSRLRKERTSARERSGRLAASPLVDICITRRCSNLETCAILIKLSLPPNRSIAAIALPLPSHVFVRVASLYTERVAITMEWAAMHIPMENVYTHKSQCTYRWKKNRHM